MDDRQEALKSWLTGQPRLGSFSLEPASGDASFRRYFRVRAGADTYIAMDAPPQNESCGPFVRVANAFAELGLNVPRIFAQDLQQGWLLLSDLGARHYLGELSPSTVDRLYGDALGALVVIQACGPRQGLPLYDRELLLREMELFREWLLQGQLSLVMSREEGAMLDRVFALLADNALEQPRVCVHRDYHSRNLLVTPSPSPGILDFQDAVLGPVAYDPVSLLRDCYVAWPRQQVVEWALGYLELAVQSGVLEPVREAVFMRWFDLMGVQRHLKASGIFARLHLRDHKPGYLPDVPRTLGYIVELAPDYPELAELDELIRARVLPALAQRA
jgi:aminoglycoside/choline kinase family phosphotransferase